MGFLDRLFGRKKNNIKKQVSPLDSIAENISKKDTNSSEEKGLVLANKIQVDSRNLDALKQRYIALDVETTGFDPHNDRIVELGAILFENGIPVKKYGTLVNPKVNISAAASRVNHITNQMIKNAPAEKEAYENLMDFLGDALQEKTVICAYNAKFDMSFLSETLMRLGYNSNIRYVDVLSLAKKIARGLVDYKQDTVANHFDLYNLSSHRAANDAEICGGIFAKLLEMMEKERENRRLKWEKNKPSEEEKEVCAVIHNMIASRNGDTDLLGFYKNSGGYVDVCYIYNIIKFKFAQKGKYIIVSNKLRDIETLKKEPCTMSEGGSDFIRLFFNSPLDLEILGDYIFDRYEAVCKSAKDFLRYNDSYLTEYKDGAIMNNALSISEVEHILSIIHSKDYQIKNVNVDTKTNIDYTNIEINPVNNRVPITEIMNLHNWDEGFDKGHPYWERGEEYRKSGNIEEAISSYDKARFYGYCAPALFESYAKAYHKLKDYDNEIDILNEGIEREGKQGTNISRMIARRNKAIELLLKQREEKQKKQKKIK